MKKYLLLFLPLLIGCTTTAERNVLNSLSAMGVVLDEPYEIEDLTRKELKGGEERSFQLKVSHKDAMRIAGELVASGVNGNMPDENEVMSEFVARTKGAKVVQVTEKGVLLDMNDMGNMYSKLYIDTTTDKLTYRYYAQLY